MGDNQKLIFFSVVVPIYNKGTHIHRSISSVLNQSFKNFELILINDASTDNSLKEIEKFSDERIQLYHRYKPGPGGYAARNLGIEKSKGKYVAFLDADDEWCANHLEKMHELAMKYADVYLLGCGWYKQKNEIMKEDSFYKEFKSNETILINAADYLNNCLAMKKPIWTSIVCINKKSPLAINLFPEDSGAKRGGDIYAWLKMICYHKEMAWINNIGAIYHLNSVNMVTKTAPVSNVLLNREVYDKFSKNLSKIEKLLLIKYLNLRLWKTWEVGSRKKDNFKLRKSLLWKGDLFNAAKYTMLSFIPIQITNAFRKFK